MNQAVKDETELTNGSKEKRDGAIQVICLGSGGGPSEDNVTALLVRSASSGWAKGSMLAVDAGTHLAAITRIFQKEVPLVHRGPARADSNGNVLARPSSAHTVNTDLESSPTSSLSPSAEIQPEQLDPVFMHSGPFAGVPLPHLSARANAAHIVRNHVATYLITHPHLDHLSGFAINTAAFHATSRPKRLAALPFTVDAIKKHIFNDIIWPNLTDEDGGVGFVSFQRLKEGGDVMVGEGEGRGYIEVCEGLGAKGFKISHGKCAKSHASTDSHRGSMSDIIPQENNLGTPRLAPMGSANGPRHFSLSHMPNHPGTPGALLSPTAGGPSQYFPDFRSEPNPTVDSTAYFVRDTASTRELLIFGDVEPDSISLTPRLSRVWAEAASKLASGVLKGIFIECSYDDSQDDAYLFGHLAPRHLIAELSVLASMTREERAARAADKAARKRKRANGAPAATTGTNTPLLDGSIERKRTRAHTHTGASGPETPPKLDIPASNPGMEAFTADPAYVALAVEKNNNNNNNTKTPPLNGLKVVIIHVKDTLMDGPVVGERILEQLEGHARDAEERGEPLGCIFEISESGQDYWF